MAEDSSATKTLVPDAPEAAPAQVSTGEAEGKASEASIAPEKKDDSKSEAVAAGSAHEAKDGTDEKKESETAADEVKSPAAEKTTTEPERDTAGEDVTEQAPTGKSLDIGGTTSNGTPASSKKNRHRSSAGVPEHRNKKVNRKKSQILSTHLHAEPGEYYFARLKGHPPWPAMICDEEMLPQALLTTRPVTAKGPDGKYREDFAEGGKREHERTFPVMFMETYEFGWIPNTDLTELDVDTVGSQPEKGKSKSLYRAYQVAAEKHDIDHFKHMLQEHQEAMRADAEAKAAKKSAKGKKSKAAAVRADDDVVMEDAADELDFDETADEPKSKPKKRKKEAADSDGEETKPAKTPKRANATPKSTPKLTLSKPKTPNGTASAGKSASKAAKPASTKKAGSSRKKGGADVDSETAAATPKAEEKPLTAAEQLEKKQKEILFLRHKLQKGFLTRDQPPKEEEMKSMSDYIGKLESYTDLEVSIMRATKIHKVLRAIVKLASIPRDGEFRFKQRSTDLLGAWNRLLQAAEGGDKPNGVGGEKTETDGGKEETKAVEQEKADEPAVPDASEKPAPAADDEPKPAPAESDKEQPETATA